MEPVLNNDKPVIIEREIIIGNMKIHIKSVFTAQTQLDKAFNNIVTRKLSETKKTS